MSSFITADLSLTIWLPVFRTVSSPTTRVSLGVLVKDSTCSHYCFLVALANLTQIYCFVYPLPNGRLAPQETVESGTHST